MPDAPTAAAARYELPPLILHPFADAAASSKVLESAKAAAEMAVLPEEPASRADQLRERLLDGRYAEFRMLFFVGKDLFRWMNQCVDYAHRTDGLKERGLVEQSFGEFLIARTPPEVEAKLRRWGVTDYARIFARSIGVHVQFVQPPPRQILGPEYLRSYYRFTDYAYSCWREAVSFPPLSAAEFTFELYASGEYSRILEDQWNG
jgi:hypothetical protein